MIKPRHQQGTGSAPLRIGRADRFFLLLRPFTVLAFALAAAFYIVFSWHWTLMLDSPVMHYVVFLMHHGLRPYLDISDNNMPGAYLTEALAMRIFGPGDLGWRLYEYFLLTTMTACMVLLARPRDWVAGIFGAGMFLALHSAEGPQYAGERELVVTVLLLLCYVALFAAVRRRSPSLLGLVGLAGGLAAAIKPTYLLFTLALFLLMALVLRRRSVSPWPYLLWGIGGLTAIGVLCLGFLLRYHVVSGFFFILTRVLPTYAGLLPPSWGTMLRAALPRSLLTLSLAAIPLAISNWMRWGRPSWERAALAVGAVLALLSFLAQRKGFVHHRYSFVALLLLVVGIELFTALRSTGWPRLLAAVLLLYALAGFVPRMLRTGRHVPPETQFYASLSNDVQALGGAAELQDKVECFDLVYGCLNVLYHDRIVENTGFTGDLLFFSPTESVARRYYRDRFWQLARKDPAAVLVVSDEALGGSNSFEKLQQWPDFDRYLQQNYQQVVERRFPQERYGVHLEGRLPAAEQDGYRIYIRDGSPLLLKSDLLAGANPQ